MHDISLSEMVQRRDGGGGEGGGYFHLHLLIGLGELHNITVKTVTYDMILNNNTLGFVVVIVV